MPSIGVRVAWTVLLLFMSAVIPVYAIEFEEVVGSGINYLGESKGASWGDFNGDDWPDIWATNRYRAMRLYVNDADGSFTDLRGVVSTPTHAAYGAAWADFDNDGDSDILNAGPGGCGGNCTNASINTLLVNDNGQLTDQANILGVDNPLGRGRTPLWVDWNVDGYLDLLVSDLKRSDGLAPSSLFTQTPNGFVNETEMASMSSEASQFAQLVSFSPWEASRIVLEGRPYPLGIYDYSSLPFRDVTSELGFPVINDTIRDATYADFNGDLLTDAFVVLSRETPPAVRLVDLNSLHAHLQVAADQKSFRFKASGDVHFQIYGTNANVGALFIGEQNAVTPNTSQFTLSPIDPGVVGIFPHEPGIDSGIYIGFDPVEDVWEVQLSASSPGGGRSFIINADIAITEFSVDGFDNDFEGEKRDYLLLQTENGFVDGTTSAGISMPTPCGSVVSADFDNDMDLDIFMVCRGAINNLSNILYENAGDGTFNQVPAALHGAGGSALGRGDSVATADFDRDGFIDLFVVNGDNTAPFNSGPHQLFRNIGNENHWLQIDLQGTLSNRDGIGAQVLVSAGGVSQMRNQDGGIHLYSQDHQRLHFGLGGNDVVDLLMVRWPSGVVQKLYDVPVDQLVTLVEPADIGLDVAQNISVGGPAEFGVISIPGDVVPFRFTGRAGDVIEIDASNVGDSADFQPCFWLTDNNHRSIVQVCDTGGSVATVTLPESGEYFLWVYDNNGIETGVFGASLTLLFSEEPIEEDFVSLPTWLLTLLTVILRD